MNTFLAGTLGSGEGIEDAVKIPKGEKLNEWLAVHVVDFMNEVSLLYGIISEFDTAEKFPVFGAGEFTYKWSDETTTKGPVSVSAPQYVENLFNWIERQLSDERIFPVDVKQPFPDDFHRRVKHIFSRLFRVYAHIYCSHMSHIVAQHAEKHVNSSLKHFILFALEFKLIRIQEIQPVRKVLDKLVGQRLSEMERKESVRRKRPSDADGGKEFDGKEAKTAEQIERERKMSIPLSTTYEGDGDIPKLRRRRSSRKKSCCVLQ